MSGLRLQAIAALVCVAALFSGCQSQTGPGAPGHDQSADTRLILALSPSGESLGPFTAGEPYDAVALEEVFGSDNVTHSNHTSEGQPYQVARILGDGTPLLDLRLTDRGEIDSVEILDGAMIEGLGISRGTSWAEVFPSGSKPRCLPGGEEESGRVLCESPQSEHLTLIFGGDWDGPDGLLPPSDLLSRWRVQRLIWRP